MADTASAQLTSLLSLLQLSDSAFPSGRYTLSYGLEAFSQSGQLTAPSRSLALGTLLDTSLRLGVAPSDGVALACAHRASSSGVIDLDLVQRADQRLSAVKLTRETREASTRTGRALLAAATGALEARALRDYAELVSTECSPGNHAIVLGLLGASLGVPRLEAVAGELYAFSAGWVAAAVRLGLTDHHTAQNLLHRVRPVAADAALDAVDRDVSAISSCIPQVDVMSMRHEQAELRLFAT